MNNKAVSVIVFLLILSIWGISFYQGVKTAFGIWSVSEIFTHCFFIIPGAFYLIIQKRDALFRQRFEANYWLLIPLIAVSFLYVFGVVGDIRLFMHIATFISLPLCIWMVIGNKSAKIIAFPLYFILFSIPIGEQLIPYLQELTTDLAVPLLELSGIPIYRNGLYLDIPAGRFLVAEACSGISFLIASVVFGNLYAYLSFKTLPKQLVFVLVSIFVPILANAIRVYGIVLTAHLTDMEYAAGADHIIYGGVFYAIILLLLIVIGEKFKDKKTTKNINVDANDNNLAPLYWPASILLMVLFSLQYFWILNIDNNYKPAANNSTLFNIDSITYDTNKKELVNWRPHFPDADNIQQGQINIDKSTKVDFFIASYGGHKGELISSTNKLYFPTHWSLVKKNTVKLDNRPESVKLTHLVSPTGKNRWIIHWYQLGDIPYTSKVKIKLNQTFNLLFGKVDRAGVIAFSIESDNNDETFIISFLDIIAKIDSMTKQVIEDKS